MRWGKTMKFILDEEQFLTEAATFWVQAAVDAVETRGRFDVALSGGRTPEQLYRLLVKNPRMTNLWSDVHIWFGDERCVPPDNAQSNFLMAKEALLDHVECAAVYRMPGELEPQEAAVCYGGRLKQLEQSNGMPVLDLIMLGIGSDGHIASLFPGSDNYLERKKPVSAAYVDKVGAWRLSLTLPVIRRARQIMVLASGTEKADVIADIMGGRGGELPAARIAELPQTVWFFDEDAAAKLPRSPTT